MKFKLLLVSIGLFFPILTIYAQTAEDALLFSNTTINGTARFQGLAGAQTALGADISSISGNPAGLGFFRKSEWSISPALNFATTNASYLGNTTTDGKNNLNIASMGIVFSGAKDDIIPGNWRGGSFGISFSRMNSYQNQFSYEGVNNVNSLTDAFVSQATGIPLSTFDSDIGGPTRLQLAYLTYLINPFTNDPGENRYYSSVAENAPVRQSETIDYTGARSQWNFSYGGNYADKLYFGASLGISRIRYGFADTYQETVLANPDELILDNFTLREDVDVRGTGVNLSAGIIYKANDIVRFGASVVSPTYYRFTDNFTPSIEANYEYTESLGSNVPLNMEESVEAPTFEYNLTTPLNASAGIAIFAGKSGFVSADVTYTTFNTVQFRSSNSEDFRETNRYIQSNFQPTVTARLGGEFRKDIFRLRAGFAYQGDAYKDMVDDLDRTRLNFTAGAGIRLPEFYIDLALVHSRFNSGFTPYTISNQDTPSVTIKNAFTNAIVSFGMFF